MAVTKILPTAHLITSANQYTKIPFQFTPENVRDACLDSIAVGMPEIELANSILGGYPSDDGSNNFMAFEDAIPEETRVTSFYMSGGDLRDKPGDYSHLMIEQIRFIRENFPDCTHFNMHPPVAKYGGPTDIGDTAKASVATWNHIAAVVSDPDIFLNVHNHLDFSCHNGYQVVQFFDEVVKEGSPQVGICLDTGHLHGGLSEKDHPLGYKAIVDKFAKRIYFLHLKNRVPSFDRDHDAPWNPETDIWAEEGGKRYGGFVPIQHPLGEVDIGYTLETVAAHSEIPVVPAAIEVDNPETHPMNIYAGAVNHLRYVHKVMTSQRLGHAQMEKNIHERSQLLRKQAREASTPF